MKVLWRFFFMLILVAYLFVSFFYLRSYAGGDVCKGVEVKVLDSATIHYFTSNDVISYLGNPQGKPLAKVNLGEMEQRLSKDGFFASVECYKLVNGVVRVEVTQRVPVMRVLDADGGFYVDQAGNRMSMFPQCRVNLPLVTGYIDGELTYHDLLPLAQYIGNDSFWNAQIEQIYVNNRHEIELSPRVGSQVVLLGTLDNYETKLDNLMQIYTQVLNHREGVVYDTISVKYKNQVVCSYKEKKK